MNIKLLYFGRPREMLATAGETADLPAGITNVASLLAWLRGRGDNWATELADARVRCAVNQELGSLSAAIREGDEVAIFSPISGG
jgi:molybdopterin synthase sulfur carrier subunit